MRFLGSVPKWHEIQDWVFGKPCPDPLYLTTQFQPIAWSRWLARRMKYDTARRRLEPRAARKVTLKHFLPNAAQTSPLIQSIPIHCNQLIWRCNIRDLLASSKGKQAKESGSGREETSSSRGSSHWANPEQKLVNADTQNRSNVTRSVASRGPNRSDLKQHDLRSWSHV